ncbi:hypothetical protein ANCCAN_17239 [Ancylostoma caninum]|uniref:Uncharacterized protein n=1 Tax=Ancylostoma caninum TaxID=29170 RepID=A0A368G0U5_ANCCA|nr:hypothetical protein ANCCAN_17239 [Ancylostoma caninum]
MLALLPLLAAHVLAFDLESAGDMALLPSGDFIDLISRDAENVPGPLAFGNKYITVALPSTFNSILSVLVQQRATESSKI